MVFNGGVGGVGKDQLFVLPDDATSQGVDLVNDDGLDDDWDYFIVKTSFSF